MFGQHRKDATTEAKVYDYRDDLANLRPMRPMLQSDIIPRDPRDPVQRCYLRWKWRNGQREYEWRVYEKPRRTLAGDLGV